MNYPTPTIRPWDFYGTPMTQIWLIVADTIEPPNLSHKAGWMRMNADKGTMNFMLGIWVGLGDYVNSKWNGKRIRRSLRIDTNP